MHEEYYKEVKNGYGLIIDGRKTLYRVEKVSAMSTLPYLIFVRNNYMGVYSMDTKKVVANKCNCIGEMESYGFVGIKDGKSTIYNETGEKLFEVEGIAEGYNKECVLVRDIGGKLNICNLEGVNIYNRSFLQVEFMKKVTVCREEDNTFSILDFEGNTLWTDIKKIVTSDIDVIFVLTNSEWLKINLVNLESEFVYESSVEGSEIQDLRMLNSRNIDICEKFVEDFITRLMSGDDSDEEEVTGLDFLDDTVDNILKDTIEVDSSEDGEDVGSEFSLEYVGDLVGIKNKKGEWKVKPAFEFFAVDESESEVTLLQSGRVYVYNVASGVLSLKNPIDFERVEDRELYKETKVPTLNKCRELDNYKFSRTPIIVNKNGSYIRAVAFLAIENCVCFLNVVKGKWSLTYNVFCNGTGWDSIYKEDIEFEEPLRELVESTTNKDAVEFYLFRKMIQKHYELRFPWYLNGR